MTKRAYDGRRMDVTDSPASSASPLVLDPDELASCVSCGLCLPHCPTYRVTGEEQYSPRGRIDAMRSVTSGALTIDDSFVDFMTTCVQCRGCETACPSGVPFGSLMDDTRATLTALGETTPWWQRLGFATLGRHRLVLVGSTLLALAQRAHLVPARLGLPRLPIRRPRPVVGTGTDVWLFTGCVMDAWQRDTHRNAATLITFTGTTYAVPGPDGACCGALHAHAGLRDRAAKLAERVMRSMPGDSEIVVDSAGCAAALKDYGSSVGTREAERFSARVVDVSEWLAARIDALPAGGRQRPPVIVQDPCHLRHVQRIQEPVRVLLDRVADVIELDDDGLCCGAGGAYFALQPDLAAKIRSRKVEAIARARASSGATLVASANPGCSMHLDKALASAGDGYQVAHPVDLLVELLQAGEPAR